VIAGLLPRHVEVAEGVIGDYQADLWPEEAACVANAVERRRREFARGRHLVRRCLRALGRPDGPLPTNQDRSPSGDLMPAAASRSSANEEAG